MVDFAEVSPIFDHAEFDVHINNYPVNRVLARHPAARVLRVSHALHAWLDRGEERPRTAARLMELVTVKLLLVPLIVLMVAGEGVAAFRRQRTRGDVAGSDVADSLTSGGIGLVGQVSGGVFRWATYLLAGLVPAWASLRWSTDSPLGTAAELIAAVLLWDFLFYWFHRAAHRTTLGWMSHRAHHESEYFNLAVALRLEWFPVLSVPIFALQAFAGLRVRHHGRSKHHQRLLSGAAPYRAGGEVAAAGGGGFQHAHPPSIAP